MRASERHELLAVASRDTARAQAYADEREIPRAYGSYEALLADPDIDAVYIPLPNHMHPAWTIRAAAAGKHILCEKPLALAVEAVDAMAAAAEAAGVVLAEAFMYRHHPRTLKVKELVDDGEIGDLHLIRGTFSFPLTRPADDIRWDPERGGGSLWDVGCYPLSFARYIIGEEPMEVFGHQVLGPTGIDVSFTGQLRFPGDVLVQIDSSFRSQFRMEMEIIGSEGRLLIPRAYKPDAQGTILFQRGDTEGTLTNPGPPLLYIGELDDLADAILHNRSPRVSLADSRANVAALLALLTSARTGQPVTIG